VFTLLTPPTGEAGSRSAGFGTIGPAAGPDRDGSSKDIPLHHRSPEEPAVNQPIDLPREQCERLLRSGVGGRVALSSPSGPHIVPVNYSVVDDAIIIRTSPYSVLGTYGRGSMLAFEVDQMDHERQRGWSVVARGRGDVVTDPAELEHIHRTWEPRPWAGGARSLYVRLRWTEITGRRIGEDWSLEGALPVRRTV
jgi:nitroimidazol reductase NimA-like FMN-containing flavoprotein (pyridoxamine 5'-phosphate oxidase superfamily)